MSWVELHENEASRAKRRCLQMLLKVAVRCHASELLCSRVYKGGLRRKRGKDFFPHISCGKKVIYEMDRRYSKRYRQTFPSDKAHKSLLESFQAIALSSFTCGA